MFVEIRKQGKKKKYYLVHSYRCGKDVRRISRYLGSDLNQKQLEEKRLVSEESILQEIRGSSFEKASESKEALSIAHLQRPINWEHFTKEFTFNTNAIEGSTVAYDQAKKLIERSELPKGSDEIETINVAKAVDFIRTTKEKLSILLIEKLHAICFEGTKHFAGKLRQVEVVIKDGKGRVIHSGARASDLRKYLNELVQWYGKHKKKHPPLVLAAMVHNQFEHIHPFQDGNGRVGRLLLNYVLLRSGYPPLNIRLLDRTQYYTALQRFDRSGDITPMIRFMVLQYKKMR